MAMKTCGQDKETKMNVKKVAIEILAMSDTYNRNIMREVMAVLRLYRNLDDKSIRKTIAEARNKLDNGELKNATEVIDWIKSNNWLLKEY
jgi:aminopeptidase-like protein